MKKKFFIGLAMSLFAVATVFNMNISEQGTSGDVSLEAIEIMAKAEAEDSSKGTLYGNAAGTRFCCKSGSNSCSAAPC